MHTMATVIISKSLDFAEVVVQSFDTTSESLRAEQMFPMDLAPFVPVSPQNCSQNL